MSDKMLSLSYILSFTGLLLIAYISPSIKPPSACVSDISTSSIEKLVRVGGNVSDHHRFDGGSMLLTLSDGSGSIEVYLPYSVAKEYMERELDCASLEVTGVVQLYRGRLEIVVERPEDISLK